MPPSSLSRRRICATNKTLFWLAIVTTVIVSIHSLLFYTRPEYADLTSVSRIKEQFGWARPTPAPTPEELIHNIEAKYPSNSTTRANAVLLMLARNSDVDGAVASIKELEDRFNKRFGYPWLFLNEVPFSNEFKEKVSAVVSGTPQFGLIPPEHWEQPDWIDEERASANRAQADKDGVPYGGSLPYRNMCRFNSGFFYRHPLVLPYKWYWRVEPDVHFPCNINYDPFRMMEDTKKVYGFTITPLEWPLTIPTLWDTVREFMDEYPQYLTRHNSLNYLSDDGGLTYNRCHFWSNFEIGNLEFWRGEAYTKFFEHLESKGGFYYERWGDAPVHSIGASLFAERHQIHFFDDIGYLHYPLQHCPRDEAVRTALECVCDPNGSYDYREDSCLRKWEENLDS
ncbi:glycosyltransferase family 15 protein [Trametes versicolor FP-101664 SS1]|uniref:glycosyltransferase family 15 protein n=1 Tax=Trametes versicolor (strain FP-101664) TaxID=717944 RepID=UPI00046227CA|nr:glycosyltransferase family 15 protein [Trametes versicolor FP-101664 SS1]EIW59804.1 glycosyltransferase family 15 protein [Trametes versicolor FP-101664 SS1]